MRKAILGSTVAIVLLSLMSSAPAALAKMPIAEIGKNKIKLEVAISQQQIEHGLMERQSMPEDQGMVFLFRPESTVRFWMFDCFMSLDMMFIKDGKIQKISRDVPPYKGTDKAKAPLYPSDGEITVTEVIEVNAGYCKRHGINDGDSVKFDLPGYATSSPAAGASGSGAGASGSGAAPASEKASSSDAKTGAAGAKK